MAIQCPTFSQMDAYIKYQQYICACNECYERNGRALTSQQNHLGHVYITFSWSVNYANAEHFYTCLHPPHSIWWRFPARRKPSQNGGVLYCVRWNGGKCVCRLVQGLLTLADPILHFTHAGNYDRRTLNTIATRSSQHHNRLARRFASQAVVGNMTNRYYRVRICVITDDNHNGMTTRKASRLCGRNSSSRVRTYVSLPTTNQCYPGTL
jgi:hypothetical protein